MYERERETQHKKWGGGEYGRVSSKKKEKLNYSGGRKKVKIENKGRGKWWVQKEEKC